MLSLRRSLNHPVLQCTKNRLLNFGSIEERKNTAALQSITLLTTKAKPRVNRRKRKKHASFLNNGNDSFSQNDNNSHGASSSTKTNILSGSDGHDDESSYITFDEYLEIASLSPWVPTPDPVARRMLEIAEASEDDIHYDLGSGDGRLNFMAIDEPFNVKQSTGIEIDDSLLQASNKRLQKRHPFPTNLNFLKADLMPDKTTSSEQNQNEIDENTIPPSSETSTIQHPVDITDATVVTMYFVEEALMKLKPMLQDQLLRSGCRIVTCGYDIEGWEPRWVEIVLGLPVYLYILDTDMTRMEDTFLLAQEKSEGAIENEGENDSDQTEMNSEIDDTFDDIDDFDDDEVVEEDATPKVSVEETKSKPINTGWKFSK